MTTVQWERFQAVAFAACILPFLLVLSPLLVLGYWWCCVTDEWAEVLQRAERNAHLAQRAEQERLQLSSEKRALGGVK